MRYTRHIKKVAMTLGTIEFGSCVLGNSMTDEARAVERLEGETVDLPTVDEEAELFAVEYVNYEGLYSLQVFRQKREVQTILDSIKEDGEQTPALPSQAGEPVTQTNKYGRVVVHYQGTADFPCRVSDAKA